jgi:CRP/FNR family transcriptional regulator
MSDNAEILSKVGLFKMLSPEELKEISPYSQAVKFNKKDTIFSEGDSSDWLFMVKEGKVKITKISQDGKEIILEIIKGNEPFGAIAVLNGFPYPANAVAMDASEVIKISRSNLMKILDRFPDVMQHMMQELGARIKDSHEAMKNIALEKVGSRIAALLLKLSEQMGEDTDAGRKITIKLTKQDIAEMVGTTVETSIRTMSKFRKMGLIDEKDGRIIIINPSALESF